MPDADARDYDGDRFTMVTHPAEPRPYYEVRDLQADGYRLPSRATNLYFRSHANAHRVASILNAEWRMFLSDPY